MANLLPIRLRRQRRALVVVVLTLLVPLAVSVTPVAHASTLPTGFQDSVVLSGMTNATVLQFASDGRIFVGQKNGVIKVFQSLSDTNPVTFADLSTQVHDYWDRGLLGLALDPGFPATPYVYVLYAHDAPIGGTAPAGATRVPPRPGRPPTAAWSQHRLSRLTASGNPMTGGEQSGRRLVPAVPQPLHRHLASAPTARST